MTVAVLKSQSKDATNASQSSTAQRTTFGAEKGTTIKTKLGTVLTSQTPLMVLLAASGVAHAAPTIDMSGVTNVLATIQTACLLIGAIIVVISLVFSVFSFAGGNIMRGITGVAGVLFGGVVIGLAPTWIASLTGQAV